MKKEFKKIINSCESFSSLLHTLDGYYEDPEVKKTVAKMISYVDSLKVVLSKATIYSRDNAGMASISDLSDKILETFSDLQDIQISHEVKKDKNIKQIIVETKKNMMIVLIIGFLGTIVLGLLSLERLHCLSRKSMMRLESFKIVTLTSVFFIIKRMKLERSPER